MRKIVRRPPRPGAAAPADLQGPEPEDIAPPPEPAAPPPPPERPAERPSPDRPADWTEAALILPRSKRLISLRIDAEVLDYFQRGGKGYQTRMNAVLRAFMEARQRR